MRRALAALAALALGLAPALPAAAASPEDELSKPGPTCSSFLCEPVGPATAGSVGGFAAASIAAAWVAHRRGERRR